MEEKNNVSRKFSVLFWGNFIPLQGIEYIINAAKILEKFSDIKFIIIGDGQTKKDILNLAEDLKIKNTTFLSRLPLEELPSYIKEADICLGIFGNTGKAKRVIPNKVYEAVAMGKPVISGDSPAIREVFTDRKDILLCKMADSKDLADKILELKNNPELREKIAKGEHETFKRKFAPRVIVNEILKAVSKI